MPTIPSLPCSADIEYGVEARVQAVLAAERFQVGQQWFYLGQQ